jgi:hypothetical protein
MQLVSYRLIAHLKKALQTNLTKISLDFKTLILSFFDTIL